MRTIQHPGVEVNEIDLSQYTPAAGGTASLIIGFADKGEDYLPLEFSSNNSFLKYFGKPTNEAERYFYSATIESISQNGRTFVAKLPYENDNKDIYMSTTYSVGVTPTDLSTIAGSGYTDYTNVTGSVDISIETTPKTTTLSALDEYRTGVSTPTAEQFIIVDVTKSKLKKDVIGREILGTYTIVNGAYNALPLQNMLTDDVTDWSSVSSGTTSAGVSALSGDLVTQYYDVDGDINKSTVSQQTASLFPPIVLDESGQLDNEYLHHISVSVIQQYIDVDNNNKIGSIVLETFIGSLNRSSVDPATDESLFIDDIINNNSNYINMFSAVSDNLSNSDTIYRVETHDENVFGYTEDQVAKDISALSITSGLDTIFCKLNNIDAVEIDMVVDAGITNIAQYLTLAYSDADSTGLYDPVNTNIDESSFGEKSDITIWKAVASKYINFCANIRKDCMAILDGPRGLALNGDQKIIRPTAPDNSVDVNILPLLKYMTGLNSSYASMYINWFQKLDAFSGKMYWCPPSIIANGVYLYTDRKNNYWTSPAGYNRGVVYTATDIAFNPNGKQQDAIYTKAFNYAINTPFDGIILSGDKTLQTKPSAFDRVNVRRMFLRLERIVRKLSKYYLYEGNTAYTRNRFVDQITPIFTNVMIGGGIMDFKIICDESNNTPDVIDRNEMICTILIKPVKSINYISLNFVATTSGASFDEIVI